MEQMRLLGLDDRIGAIDVGAIAIDQIGTLIKTLPPDKWGRAAKSLPEGFVTEICKKGVASKASIMLAEYGPSMGVGIVVGAGVASFSKNTLAAIACGAGASLAFYLLSSKSDTTNA